MDTKHLIASEIQKVVPYMEQSAILSLLETPKNSSMGDLAFPAFSLAKTL
ncbi:arginine--tRNA ligase, partial [Streptococcus suis]|nr:arginine--tRNA ligase [Streptococcus suis]